VPARLRDIQRAAISNKYVQAFCRAFAIDEAEFRKLL
jgi:hypothetical protein